jgi:hypothetical protein
MPEEVIVPHITAGSDVATEEQPPQTREERAISRVADTMRAIIGDWATLGETVSSNTPEMVAADTPPETADVIREEHERSLRNVAREYAISMDTARSLLDRFREGWGDPPTIAGVDEFLATLPWYPLGTATDRPYGEITDGHRQAMHAVRWAGETEPQFSRRVMNRLAARYPHVPYRYRQMLRIELGLPVPADALENSSAGGLRSRTGSGTMRATPSPNERSEMPATAETVSFRPRLQIQDYLANVVSELGYEVPQDELLFGLEWEMIAANGVPSLTAHLYDVQAASRTFIAKYDGSVGSSGLELVTLPLSLSQQMAFVDSVNMAEVRESRTCGVHIHITRRVLSEGQILRILNFINAGSPLMNKFITAVARRQENLYCRRTGVSHTDLARVRSTHYDAVGLSHRHPTLELRIFKTTNNAQYLKSYIQFAHALVAYNALDTVDVRPAHSVTDPQDFCAYVIANRASYPDLATRISRASYNEFRGIAPVARQPRVASVARVSPVTGYRERRVQSQIPTTATVAGWIMTNIVGVAIPADSSAAQGAVWMRSHLRHPLVSRFAYWYAENCTNNGTRFSLVTATGRQVDGAAALRTHALYHLELVDH